MRVLRPFILIALALWSVTTAAFTLIPGAQLSAPGATQLEFMTIVANVPVAPARIQTGAFQDTLVITQAIFEDIRRRLPADKGATSLLLLKNAAGGTVSTTQITSVQDPATNSAPVPTPMSAGSSSATTAPASGIPEAEINKGRPKSQPASRADCSTAARAWQAANPEDWKNDGRDAFLVLFNHDARVCYESTQTPAQGDTIIIGVVWKVGDEITAKADLSQCSREPVQPNIYVSGKIKDYVPLAGGAYAVDIVEMRRCWDKEISLTMSVKDHLASDAETQGVRPLTFYERFRGTLQLGVIYTDLHENDFSLRSSGSDQVIFNKEADNSGPQWVASVVVYGLPRYFMDGALKAGYHGRDIINENNWPDRIGLVFLAGLDDPGDRFGVGLSLELVYGINLFWTQEWFRQQKLVGFSEGDVFTGAASEIPTQHSWESDSTFGLSFDLRYITALFKGD